MVDLGISRTQDVQNPLPANTPVSHIPPEGQDRNTRPPVVKMAKKAPEETGKAENRSVDLESEVGRINDLLGKNTRIRFVINRTSNDIYIAVVDRDSNQVLKTIPPSELTSVSAKIMEGGILVDNRS
jgi:uncharacterized FlaG/YvyC family protein